MHACNHMLAAGLSTVLLIGCASAPPQRLATASEATQGSGRALAHGMFFVHMVTAAVAFGGNNPNPAYRTLSAQLLNASGCASDPRVRDRRAQPITGPSSCQRLATTK